MAGGNGTFAYEAQTEFGQPLTGTIEAATAEEARKKLALLRLRVSDVRAAEAAVRPKRQLGRDDFLAFNQQLAHLSAAGLPVEQGLRLIAEDVRSGRLASVAREVAADLERGQSLAQAFERHRSRFPDLYGELIDAGVKTGNLPGMLLNLGRHVELVARLRYALWRVAAYPLSVLGGMVVVALFLSVFVLPQLRDVYRDFRTNLPALTEGMLVFGAYLPLILVVGLVVVIVVIGLWQLARLTGVRPALIDTLVLPLPVIGSILRKNLLARWCDVVKLGVDAGLDLPAALKLAGKAIGSPEVKRETQGLIETLEGGRPMREARAGWIIPSAVTAAIDLSPRGDSLSTTLGTMAQMYAMQSEHRLRTLPAILTPFLLAFVATTLGLSIVAVFLPLVKLIQSVSGEAG